MDDGFNQRFDRAFAADMIKRLSRLDNSTRGLFAETWRCISVIHSWFLRVCQNRHVDQEDPQREASRMTGVPSPSPDADAFRAAAETMSGRGAAPRRRSETGARAHLVAGLVEKVSWVFLIAGVMLGIAVAVETEVDEFTGEEFRPNVAEGIALALLAAFQALVVIMFATYIRYRTEAEVPAAPVVALSDGNAW